MSNATPERTRAHGMRRSGQECVHPGARPCASLSLSQAAQPLLHRNHVDWGACACAQTFYLSQACAAAAYEVCCSC